MTGVKSPPCRPPAPKAGRGSRGNCGHCRCPPGGEETRPQPQVPTCHGREPIIAFGLNGITRRRRRPKTVPGKSLAATAGRLSLATGLHRLGFGVIDGEDLAQAGGAEDGPGLRRRRGQRQHPRASLHRCQTSTKTPIPAESRKRTPARLTTMLLRSRPVRASSSRSRSSTQVEMSTSPRTSTTATPWLRR